MAFHSKVTLTTLAILAGCGGDGKTTPAADPPATQPAAAEPAPGSASGSGEVSPEVMAAGKEGFLICQTCHQAEGQGVPGTYPPLAGSEIVTGAPDRVIAIVLYGLNGPITVAGKPFNNVMAPWGALEDEQLAATITYVRNSFGNRASMVTAADVAAVRKATAGRSTAWTIEELNTAKLK